MFGLGATEIIIILIVVLLVFGAGKLPKIMEDLGKGYNAFRKSIKDDDTDTPTDKKDDSKK